MPVLLHASPTDLRILNRLCRYRGINLEKCRDRNAIDPIVAQPRPLLMKANVSICYGTWSISLPVLMCLINAVSPGDESLQSTSVSVRPVGYFVPVVTLYLVCCQEFWTHQTSFTHFYIVRYFQICMKTSQSLLCWFQRLPIILNSNRRFLSFSTLKTF